eukprot:12928710-Prorocentrum_lima.AAC.1
MHYATALREAVERRDAEGVVTGIAGNAPKAINPPPIEPEPMQQEIAKWKKLRFMDLFVSFPGIVTQPQNMEKAYS